jgi:hypothetical protein
MVKKYKNIQEFIEKDFLDKKGNAVINIDLKNEEDLFSPFSEKMLNPEILNYLDTLSDPIPPKYPLIINFILENTEIIDVEYVKDALRRYYWTKYENKRKKIKTQIAFNISAILIGFTSMLFGLFFKPTLASPFFVFFTEFSFLISWLFLWEGISNFIGINDKIKDRDDEKQMAAAKLRFLNRRKKKEISDQQYNEDKRPL